MVKFREGCSTLDNGRKIYWVLCREEHTFGQHWGSLEHLLEQRFDRLRITHPQASTFHGMIRCGKYHQIYREVKTPEDENDPDHFVNGLYRIDINGRVAFHRVHDEKVLYDWLHSLPPADHDYDDDGVIVTEGDYGSDVVEEEEMEESHLDDDHDGSEAEVVDKSEAEDPYCDDVHEIDATEEDEEEEFCPGDNDDSEINLVEIWDLDWDDKDEPDSVASLLS
ncbi:uncharacterized protein BO72DRAFT_509137 [Aspergillus fijiensis CBS 313.89]|uniref:Uncharacterized protein n=1 Tax=Aspergillus fijiensis CBS 313.89 TaxID=1448319 RepID=A0A8G1RR28_9EURO|nr:uncharacterized protein BO72DRAFT_509137 [Aspergillus fijiensis CBS 313.89]RAK77724.1 hypothetical protein BO72DRAFT_509137 [Aspergillus fijiensis CBS 313.89]